MKQTRKISVLFLIMAMVISVSACQARDPDNRLGFSAEELATLDEVRAGAKRGETEAADGEDLAVPYPYGDMQQGQPNFLSMGDRVVFSNLNDQLHHFWLYTLDPETLEVSLLCKDPTCGHTKPQCIACDKGGMEQYDGTLYVENSIAGGEIMALQGERLETAANLNALYFVHGNGKLYVATADGLLVCYEPGGDKPVVLAENFYGNNLVVYGNYLYATSTFHSADPYAILRVDLSREDPEVETVRKNANHLIDVPSGTFYFIGEQDGCLYRCDENFKNEEKLAGPFLIGSSVNFDENYLYLFYIDKSRPYEDENKMTLYRISKENPGEPEPFVTIPEGVIGSVYTVPGGDYLYICAMLPPEEEGNSPGSILYAVKRDTGELTRLDIPEI